MTKHWLVCYDITDNRRRSKIARCLLNTGIRRQKSVFEVEATAWMGQALREQIARLLQANKDSVRWYPLCPWCSAAAFHQGTLYNDPMLTPRPPYYLV